MSDETCPQCGAAVPVGAAFCTTCGSKIGDGASGSEPTAPPPTSSEPADEQASEATSGDEVTRVEGPALHDHTQVLPESAPADPAAGPGWAAPAAPGSDPSNTPPSAPAWGAAPAAEGAWGQPTSSPPSSWDQPAPAPSSWDQPGAPAAAAWPAPATTTGTSSATGGAPLSAIVGLLGGLLTIIGLFLPWVTGKNGLSLVLVGSDDMLTGWALATKDQVRIESQDAYWLLALGVIALIVSALLFARAMPPLRIALAVIGLAIVGLTIYDLSSISSVVNDTFTNQEEIDFGLGLYLTLAGGIVCLVAACLPAARRTSS